MIKIVSTLGFCLGILILGIVYFNGFGGSAVVAAEEVSSCKMVDVPLDEGYGVSRTELRWVCAR